MKCADPILCYTSERRRQLRHFSLASFLFKQMAQQVFNCGTCEACRKKRAHELAIRCVLHASLSEQNCFLTLTYDENLPDYHNKLQYSDIQKFKKRLRRWCEHHDNKKIQIFNVHEYGKKGKKHWHLVVFNHDFSDKQLKFVKNGNKLFTSKQLAKLWPHGLHTIGDVTEASAMYQSQYTQKDFINGNAGNEKKSKSNHSGIGRDFFLQNYKQILTLGYIPFSGKKIPVPRYFQKIAHKHYCHFYQPDAFHDLTDRKRIHNPFKIGQEKKEIADLYLDFAHHKNSKILELELEWETFISEHLLNKTTPDFKKSADNYLHDLKTRPTTKQSF